MMWVDDTGYEHEQCVQKFLTEYWEQRDRETGPPGTPILLPFTYKPDGSAERKGTKSNFEVFQNLLLGTGSLRIDSMSFGPANGRTVVAESWQGVAQPFGAPIIPQLTQAQYNKISKELGNPRSLVIESASTPLEFCQHLIGTPELKQIFDGTRDL